MKIQIIVDKNLVIIDDTSINIDCAKFKEQFIFCEVNEKDKWIEKEPFNGKEQPKHWNEIKEFIDIAKSKSNPPNSYSVWNGDAKSWVEDAVEREKNRVQNINSYTQSIITKKYPLEKQSSANLGIYSEEYKTEMISFISNCITLSNEAIENNTSFEDYKAMLDEY